MGGKRPGRGAPAKRSVPAVLAAEGAGVGPRRHPAELRMRSLLVVIVPPGLQHGTSVRQRFEQRLVQQLVAQAAVEALDEAVLLRLAGRDVVPADAGRIRPAQDRIRGQLGAVVADDRVRASPAPANNIRSSSSWATRRPEIEVSATTARMRKRRASVSWSETKSRLQRWLAASGVAIGRRVPIARLRPPRRRTVSRSSRYRHWTRFLLTTWPSRRNSTCR